MTKQTLHFGSRARRFLGGGLFALGAILLSPAVQAQAIPSPTATSTATQDASCVGTRWAVDHNNALTCNSQDLKINETVRVLVPNQPTDTLLTSCVNGSEITVDLLISMPNAGSTDRYIGGLYFGQQNNAPNNTNNPQLCSVAHFPGTSTGTGFTTPLNASAGNIAGSYKANGSEEWKIKGVKLTCVADSQGRLNIPYTLIWENNANSNVVIHNDNDPAFYPSTSSKCGNGVSNAKVTVMAGLTLNKAVSGGGPANASDFTLTATGSANPVVTLTGNGSVTGNVPVGTYTLSESSSFNQYVPGAWSCSGAGVSLSGNVLTLDSTATSVTCGITNTLRQTDLAITKTPVTADGVPGNMVTWTVTASNLGPTAVTGASIKDTFPAGLINPTWTATTAGPNGVATGFNASGSGGGISDTVNMPVGSTITYTVTAQIDPAATGSLVNTANIATPANTVDSNPNNNQATSTITLKPTADVVIVKSQASPNPAILGKSLTWTITVTNNGPSTATTVKTSDPVNAAVTGLSVGGANGSACTVNVQNVNCDFGAISPSGTRTYTITGTLSSTFTDTEIVNTATVTFDPSRSKDSTSTTPVISSNLSVTKTNNLTEVVKDSTIEYTVTITNDGKLEATGVSWTDVSTGLQITNIAAGSSGTCTTSGCSGITVPAAGSVIFTVTAKVTGDAGTNAINTAKVVGGESCTTTKTCDATDRDPIVAPKLAITKSTPTLANVSGNQWTATYIVTVSNTGTADGKYTLSDTPAFPSGVTLNSWNVTTSGGTLNSPVPGVTGGQISATDVVIVKNNATPHTYTVAITFTTSAAATALTCNGTANNGAFNTASIPIGSVTSSATACANLPKPLKLTLAKAASVAEAANGDSFNYTVHVSNTDSPVATTNPTTLVDVIPVGITVTAVSGASGFTCTPSGVLPLAGDGSANISCTSTGVAAGATDLLVATLTVKKTNTSDVTNTVTATTGDPRCTGAQNPCTASVTVTNKNVATSQPTPVPTLSEWAMLLLGALLGGLGWLQVRRRATGRAA